MKNLNSPNIPLIYDVEEDEEYTYIVEQYIEGESLGSVVKHRLLTEKEVFDFIIRISSIIEYLHTLPEQMLYLDLKPENVLVSGEDVYLIDFGSAASALSAEVSEYASRGFCAPEQKDGQRVGFSTDIYSLGILLEFMLKHSSIAPHRKKKLSRVAQRCGMSVPWMRINSADILIKMIEKIRDEETTVKKQSGRAEGLSGRRIGVLGLGPGEGATHITIALANYLAEYGHGSVCLVEQNEHKDIGRLLEESTGKAVPADKPVRLNGVTYLTNDTEDKQQYLLNSSFDNMVFDLGNNRQRAMSTLQLCDIRIVVASAAPWRRSELDFLAGFRNGGEKPTGWILLVNLAQEKHLRRLPDFGLPIIPFPYEADPLDPGKETALTIKRALR